MNFTSLVETLEQLAETVHQEEHVFLDSSFFEQVKTLSLLSGTANEVVCE